MFAYAKGLELTFGDAWRSNEEQRRLVNAGLSQTMNSKHAQRLAVDFNLFKDGELTWKVDDYRVLGDYWETIDPLNVWGGNWKTLVDAPHFERKI